MKEIPVPLMDGDEMEVDAINAFRFIQTMHALTHTKSTLKSKQ